MDKAISTQRSRNRNASTVSLKVWNACALLCLGVATTAVCTEDTSIPEIRPKGDCRDTDSHYQCTPVGEISGKIVVKGTLQQCSNETTTGLPPTILKLVQFEVSQPSTIAITAEGLLNMTMHAGASMEGLVLAEGVFFQMALTRGAYTLASEIRRCVSLGQDDQGTYRIDITNLSETESAGMTQDGVDHDTEQEWKVPDPVIATANTLGTTALIVLVGTALFFLVVGLAYTGYGG